MRYWRSPAECALVHKTHFYCVLGWCSHWMLQASKDEHYLVRCSCFFLHPLGWEILRQLIMSMQGTHSWQSRRSRCWAGSVLLEGIFIPASRSSALVLCLWMEGDASRLGRSRLLCHHPLGEQCRSVWKDAWEKHQLRWADKVKQRRQYLQDAYDALYIASVLDVTSIELNLCQQS